MVAFSQLRLVVEFNGYNLKIIKSEDILPSPPHQIPPRFQQRLPIQWYAQPDAHHRLARRGEDVYIGADFQADVIIHIEAFEVGVDKGLHGLQGIDQNETHIRCLGIFIVAVAQAAEGTDIIDGAAGEFVFLSFPLEVKGVAEAAVEALVIIDHQHHAGEGAIDERHFPPPLVVELPRAGNDQGKQGRPLGVGIVAGEPVLFFLLFNDCIHLAGSDNRIHRHLYG